MDKEEPNTIGTQYCMALYEIMKYLSLEGA